MSRFVVLLLGAALAQPACAAAQAADPVREILQYQDAATEAFRRGDALAIDTLLADDFTLTSSTGERTTKAEEMASVRSGAVRFTEFRNVDQTVRLYAGGTAAVVTGRTLIDATTRSGTRIEQDVTFTDTLVRIGGRWRMVASHASPTPKR
jgi:ketosteroid isomerase-like protein